MQKLESSSICSYTGLGVDLFISGLGFIDIFSVNISLVEFVKVIIIDGRDGKIILSFVMQDEKELKQKMFLF